MRDVLGKDVARPVLSQKQDHADKPGWKADQSCSECREDEKTKM